MGMSLPSAEFISFWANWLLVGALVVGVIATWGIVVSGDVKETALKRDLGEAVARASEANAKALQAQLELAKYRVGRSLREEQKSQMEEVLKSAPKDPVIIKPNFLSPKPTRYANELSEVFNKSGFSNVGTSRFRWFQQICPDYFWLFGIKSISLYKPPLLWAHSMRLTFQ